ncbi:MAG: ComEC/Rec2 family competence protein [Pseudomonadota bacterium]
MVKEGFIKKVAIAVEDIAGRWMVQPLLWLPLALGTGIAFYFNLRLEPDWPPIIIAFMTLLGITIVSARFSSQAIMHVLLIAALWAISGVCLAKLRVATLDAPILRKETGWREVRGTITQLDPISGTAARIVMDQVSIEDVPPDQTPHKVRITLKRPGDAPLSLGQRIMVRAMLHPPSLPATATSYDFQRHYYLQQMGAVGFSPLPITVIKDVQPDSFLAWFGHVRTSIQSRVEKALPPDQAGIVIAMMTGAQTGITESIMDDYRASGLVHILSVSGMHIGMIAGAVFFMVRLALVLLPFIGLHWPVKKIAAMIALLATLTYILMIGPLLPAWRAMMMTGLILLAVMLDRVALSLRTLALAALTLLIFLPESLTNIGFQLSFLAVFALIALYEQVRDIWPTWMAGWPPFIRFSILWGGGMIMTGMIATIATAPLILYHFQQLPLYGALANAAATPILTFITMPLVIVAFVALPFGLADGPIALMGSSVHWINMAAAATAHLPYPVFHTAQGSLAALIVALCGVFFLCIGRRTGQIFGVACCLFSIMLWPMRPLPSLLVYPPGKLWMVKTDQDVWIVPGLRQDVFVREQWQSLLAIPPDNVMSLSQAKKAGVVTCDKAACRLNASDGQSISIVNQPHAAAEECQWADIVISASSLGRACTEKQLDRYYLKRIGPVMVGKGWKTELLPAGVKPRPWRQL